MIRKGLYILMAVVAAMIAGGCANDLPDEGSSTGKARFSISAMQSNSSTRADGDTGPDGKPTDAESDTERINDWWMVFVQSNGTVRKILHREDANPGLGSYTGASLPVVEEEYFECDLPRGTYTVYAFANITQDELKAATGITFKLGEKPSRNGQDVTVSTAVWNTNLNLWDKSKPVPMTGIRSINVKNTVEETFSIEVVRMVAKLEFKFTNDTDDEITVNSISIDPITSPGSPVSLFPDYGALGNHAYEPITGTVSYTLQYPKPVETTTPAVSEEGSDAAEEGSGSSTVIADGNGGNVKFYCKESIANTLNNNHFTIGVKITRKNIVNGETKFTQEEERYSPTDLIAGYINRNDWIVIPIRFTDWIVDFDVMFYPPIGGYPAVKEDDKSDPHSRYFTFKSQGKFVIIPKVRKAIPGSDWLQPDQYLPEKTVDKDGNDLRLTVSDPSGIFYVAPKIDDKTGEIIGELAMTGNKGTAVVTLTLEPKAEGAATRTISYKLYIRRE